MKKITLISAFLFIAYAVLGHAAERSVDQKTVPKISVQLWSVKDALAQDFKGTIKQLAEMGFQGVELAGDFGEFADDPVGLAEFLKSHGLEISGAHEGFDDLSEEKFDDIMTFYAKAGVPSVIVPWDERAFKPQTIWQTIADLNRLLPKVEEYGLNFGYHNHGQEFAAYREGSLWDHIAYSTPDSFVLQLDVGWANSVGADPVHYVRKYPGRTLTTHYKAQLASDQKDRVALIGQDAIDWPALIKANIEVGGTQWIVLEQEEYPNDLTPLQAVKASKLGLDEFLKEYL